jgi:hypothetical protein
MADINENVFTEEEREDLLEREFNEDQIEILEQLELDKRGLYSNICHQMDENDNLRPENMIAIILKAYTRGPRPITGGNRKRSKKSRKMKSSKRRKMKSQKRRKMKIKSYKKK